MANENSLLGDVARYLAETYAPVEEEEDEGSEEVVEIGAEAEVEDVNSEDEDADDQIESGDEHDNEENQHATDVKEGAPVHEEAEAEAGDNLEEEKEGQDDDDDEDKTLVDVSEDEDEDSDEYERESESEGDILDTFLNIFKNPPPRLLELQQTDMGRKHLTLANALRLVNSLRKPNPEVILLSRLFELEQTQFERAEPGIDSNATAAIRVWFSLAGTEASGRLCGAVEEMTGGVSPTAEQKERFKSYLDNQ